MNKIILFLLKIRVKRLRAIQSWDCIKNNGYGTESQRIRGEKIRRTLLSIEMYEQSKV